MIAEVEAIVPLLAAWSTLTYDFVARRRISGKHLNFFLAKQLPLPISSSWSSECLWLDEPVDSWLRRRLAELIFTGYELFDFVEHWGIGARPFIWDDDRRVQVMAEIEAFFMCLHDLNEGEVETVLEDFGRVRDREIATAGEFRTGRLVKAAFEAMHEARASGVPYRSPLNPPAGHAPRHPAKES